MNDYDSVSLAPGHQNLNKHRRHSGQCMSSGRRGEWRACNDAFYVKVIVSSSKGGGGVLFSSFVISIDPLFRHERIPPQALLGSRLNDRRKVQTRFCYRLSTSLHPSTGFLQQAATNGGVGCKPVWTGTRELRGRRWVRYAILKCMYDGMANGVLRTT